MIDLKVVSWDGHAINDGSNYVAGIGGGPEWGLPPVQVRSAKRRGAWPLVASIERPGHSIVLIVRIVGNDRRTLRDQLLRWFDPEDEEPKRLVISDLDDSNGRYVTAICTACTPLGVGGVRPGAEDTFNIILSVHGDVRWRSTTNDTDTWGITASGQTRNIVNDGTDDAYPVIKIKPTSAKSGGYAYRRFAAITWLSANSAGRYPLIITLDTQTLITAGKMQADGDDLRVIADGTEIDRWLYGINTTTTKIQVNLDFQPAVSMTLKTGIDATGSISSIEVNEDISRMPESGILLIDSEVFTYTARVLSEKKFTGITRAAKGSSMAAHTAGTSVRWLQHEIWLVYGNAAVSAPSTDDRFEAAFDLSSSSNTSWVYSIFNDSDRLRAGGWQPWGNISVTSNGGVYTDTQRTLASGDFIVIGAWLDTFHSNAYGWYLSNPCGITNVTWSDGYKRRAGDGFLVHCMHWPRGASWWEWHYNPTSPTMQDTWEAWSYSGTAFDVSETIGIAAYFYPQDVEVGGATVTLNSSETPGVSVLDELGNYSLNATITNTTTGEAIKIDFVMSLDAELEIDCDTGTVTYLADNSRQMAAMSLSGEPRRRWLRLVPGANTLRFDDTGTTGVTVTVEWCKRYY